ncbi:tetratricopeptide repeat protein [Actinomadura scrupuli]|uniref:tetratricopeptide repeat protein n=1 Tax=Actinomadura scrupuli TaxID=559629 RepID=UPI003D9893DA
MTTESAWEQRLAELWAALDDLGPADFLAQAEALAAERPPGDGIALFELASANDSTGRPEQAAPLYRQALAAGLTGPRRRRAVIQLASTLRNLGRPEESVVLLTAEREAASDDLDDAVAAFLALALADTGREREAAGLALAALARHLPRYNRSLAAYAGALSDPLT